MRIRLRHVDEPSFGLAPRIKWPNDVLIAGRKVAGILVESVWNGEAVDSSVIGIGLNVSREAVPPQEMLAFPATSIEEALGDSAVPPRELILRLGPDYGLFAPYSALPQALSMQSLEGSGVPAPKVFWYGDDPSILGAPFLITDKAKGAAVLPWAGTKPLEEGPKSTIWRATSIFVHVPTCH